jgi:hypothetical protein
MGTYAMRFLAVIATVCTFSVAGCLSQVASSEAPTPASSEAPTPTLAADGNPVVLELFTSQGCSSCPSADRLLAQLSDDPKLRGNVIPLAFHVDYWNYIGWSDPFSSPTWTQRQNVYAKALRNDGLYTPQLVIQGKSHVTGSDEGGALREIADAMKAEPTGRVSIAPVRVEGTKLQSTASVEMTSAAPADLKIYAALFENGLVTPVKRGENNGRTLQNDFVVRRYAAIGEISAKAGATREAPVSFDLEPGWKHDKLGIAIILQDPKSMRIYGATVRPAN